MKNYTSNLEFVKMFTSRYFYYTHPRKTIVILLCCVRSGSTLLKALLAEAEDVSHLPEIDFRDHMSDKYGFYRSVYALDEKRILVLKRPHWFKNANDDRDIPALPTVKTIVLLRDVSGVVGSIKDMLTQVDQKRFKEYIDYDENQMVDYWCDTYENIYKTLDDMDQNYRIVKYEELVANPKAVTADLFSYIGSQQKEGVDVYKVPEKYTWDWGKDDGGQKIKNLKVQKSAHEGFSIKNEFLTNERVTKIKTMFDAKLRTWQKS